MVKVLFLCFLVWVFSLMLNELLVLSWLVFRCDFMWVMLGLVSSMFISCCWCLIMLLNDMVVLELVKLWMRLVFCGGNRLFFICLVSMKVSLISVSGVSDRVSVWCSEKFRVWV